MARWRPAGGTYRKQKLGQADDTRDADGLRILSFAQAQSRARDWFAAQDRTQAGAGERPGAP